MENAIVLESLQKCLNHAECPAETEGCCFYGWHDCKERLFASVLEICDKMLETLNKDMEALNKPMSIVREREVPKCPRCHETIAAIGTDRCPYCNQAVNW